MAPSPRQCPKHGKCIPDARGAVPGTAVSVPVGEGRGSSAWVFGEPCCGLEAQMGMAVGARMFLLVTARKRLAWELPELPSLLRRPQGGRGQEKFSLRLKEPPASFFQVF